MDKFTVIVELLFMALLSGCILIGRNKEWDWLKVKLFIIKAGTEVIKVWLSVVIERKHIIIRFMVGEVLLSVKIGKISKNLKIGLT